LLTTVSTWLAAEDVVVINGDEMINLDDSEKVDVRRIK